MRPEETTTERPNIVFITTDHLRRDMLGCAGHPVVQTSHIDALAAEGVRCEWAYTVSPLCMPARASWVTGRYMHEHGIFGNQRPPLRPDQRRASFANALQRAGYRTALIGKHHFLDAYYQPGTDYTAWEDELKGYGFDDVHQVLDTTESVFNGDDFVPILQARGVFDQFCREYTGREPALTLNLEDTSDGHIGSRSVEFIEQYDRDQPFFLWTSFVGPHPPYKTPSEFYGPYAEVEVEHPRHRAYFGMVSHIDHWVGRITEALRYRGVLENALVILTSDHGDMLGERGIWDKRHFYEASVGVPLIGRGPGLPTGDVCQALIESVDVTAGILHAAGVAPEEPAQEVTEGGRTRIEVRPCVPLPGRPFQRLVAGDPRLLRRDVFSELGTTTMIRDARWKLWTDPQRGGVQALHDLTNDPDEQQNLAGRPEYREIEDRLVGRLFERYVTSTVATEVKERKRVQRIIVRTE